MAWICDHDLFLQQAGGASAALAFMATNGIKLNANPLGLPIGSQTYPHLARIQSGDFAGLLKDMKAIGIISIELCPPGYKQFTSLADGKTTRKILDDNGIKAVSAHFTMPDTVTRMASPTPRPSSGRSSSACSR